MRTKKLMVLLFSMALTLAALSGCSDNASGSMSSFTADTLDGGTFTQEDIKAKDVTIVNFWGMFCGPCRSEMPHLAEYAKALPDNVQLITACIDARDDLEGTKEFLESAGFEGVTLLGGDGDFQALFDSIQAFPTTILLNSRGEIVGETFLGEPDDLTASYTAAVNKILKSEGKAEISVAG